MLMVCKRNMASARNGLHRFLVLWLCVPCNGLYVAERYADREDVPSITKIETICTHWPADSARVPQVFPNSNVAVRLRGTGLHPNRTELAFTREYLESGGVCQTELFVASQFQLGVDSTGDVIARGVIPAERSRDPLYLCTRNRGHWKHQGKALRIMYAPTSVPKFRRHLASTKRSTDRDSSINVLRHNVSKST